jgi:hypothetical protein
LQKIIDTHHIPERIYNMDEKGFLMGLIQVAKVICRKGDKAPRKTQDGNREMITVLETVSASGKLLPPFIIYEGKAHYAGWHSSNVEQQFDVQGSVFAVSPNGWTDQELGVQYLKQLFIPRVISGGEHGKCLLILDGHTSHDNWEFFECCLNHNIIPYQLPPHSTHLLQPLDVGLFGPLQNYYSQALENWSYNNSGGIWKGEFLP